jgi:acetolactate synthase I/III small subunit
MQLAGVFRARVVDVAPTAIVIEITGTEDKIDGLLDVLRHYGILEMVRTGRVAMSRGANGTGSTLAASAAAGAAADSGAPLLDTDDGMIAFSV